MTTFSQMQSCNQSIDPQGSMPYHRRFEIASEFANSMEDVLAISDHHQYGESFIWYHVIRHIMQYAFNYHPAPSINYQKVLISRGPLWNTRKAIAEAAAGTITFTWTSDLGIGGTKRDDQCILVAYCER